jgi:hypothetical protein
MTTKTQARRAVAPLPTPRELWDATTTPDIVTVPARTVFALEGRSAPEGETFQRSVAAVYGVAYTLKFARKKAGRADFKIGPLEARWWTDEPGRRLPDVPRHAWRWQLRLALPDDVSVGELARAVDAATHKAGGQLYGSAEAGQVTLALLPAERCGRVLHIGPYAAEGESIARIAAMVEHAGLTTRNPHVEVYLSDPRRTKPKSLKTVLLVEVVASRGA